MTKATGRRATLTAEQADEILHNVFGSRSREEHDRASVTTFPDLAIDLAIQIIDGEMGGVDIAAMHAEWAAWEQKRKGPGGRPPLISTRQMLILWLMHAIAGEPMSKRHMADTLLMRLTDEQLHRLGLPRGGDGAWWYKRLESAHHAMLEPIDPLPYPKYPRQSNRPEPKDRLTAQRNLRGPQRQTLDEWHAQNRELLEVRGQRLDDLMFQLVANTVRQPMMQSGLFEGYEGHLAIDATLVKAPGKPSSPDLSEDARSTSLGAGAWVREGNHGPSTTAAGQPTKLRLFGYDAELVAMATNAAPALIVGVCLHKPGAITEAATTLLPRIDTLGLPKGELSADRAYNNLSVEKFHEVLLQYGYESVYQYPKDELGVQAYYYKSAGTYQVAEGASAQEAFRATRKGVGYLMVDGSWYLDFMPPDLIDCVRRNSLGKDDPDYLDSETCAARVKARADYQLTRHGLRDSDGFQRHKLPDPTRYVAWDVDTGEEVPKPTVKTVSIPMKVGLRWAQKYPYMSDAWRTAYNRRTEVERKNAQLKHPSREDLSNPLKRPGRGFAASSLAVAMLVAAHNIRTFDNFVRALEGIDTTKSPRRRARRRSPDDIIIGVRPQRDGRTVKRAA